MKIAELMIAWNPGTDQVKVGPKPFSLPKGTRDWSRYPVNLRCSAGGVFANVKTFNDLEARHYVMSEFIGLTVRDEVSLRAAHQEFMQIDEYRAAIPGDLEAWSARLIREGRWLTHKNDWPVF